MPMPDAVVLADRHGGIERRWMAAWAAPRLPVGTWRLLNRSALAGSYAAWTFFRGFYVYTITKMT